MALVCTLGVEQVTMVHTQAGLAAALLDRWTDRWTDRCGDCTAQGGLLPGSRDSSHSPPCSHSVPLPQGTVGQHGCHSSQRRLTWKGGKAFFGVHVGFEEGWPGKTDISTATCHLHSQAVAAAFPQCQDPPQLSVPGQHKTKTRDDAQPQPSQISKSSVLQENI